MCFHSPLEYVLWRPSVRVRSFTPGECVPLDVEAGHLGAVPHIGIRSWLTLYRLGIS